MKKISLMLSILVMCFVSNVYAGGVTDDNNGNKGDLFVSTGENHGANSVGEWVDSSSFKGDKGDKGNTGSTGQDGLKGDNGNDGMNGVDGKDGKKGDTGSKGDKGDTGKGLKNPVELQVEGVIKETKNVAFSVYDTYDFHNNINTIGAKVKIYLGKSYAEQVREDLQSQIDEMK